MPRRRRVAEDEFDAGAPKTNQSQDTSGSQFRRNQTLSSYRRSAPDESSRQKAHHLTMQRRRMGGAFAIVAAATVLLLLLLWQLIVQVHVTTSAKQLSTPFKSDAYEQSIGRYLALNPAQRLRAVLNEDDLSMFVANDFPEVGQVELRGSAGVARVDAVITFRTPVAGWQINGKQYYVDVDGMVFEKNYYDTPTVQIIDESGINPDQGGIVVGTRLLGFLGRVVSEAQGRGYTITHAVLPEGTTRQVEVRIEGVRTRIKLSIDRGAGEQVRDADLSLKHLKSRGVTAQYIDVRVPGRAAYR